MKVAELLIVMGIGAVLGLMVVRAAPRQVGLLAVVTAVVVTVRMRWRRTESCRPGGMDMARSVRLGSGSRIVPVGPMSDHTNGPRCSPQTAIAQGAD